MHPLDPESDPDKSAYSIPEFLTMLEQQSLVDLRMSSFVSLDTPGLSDEGIVSIAIAGLNRQRSTYSGGSRHAWAMFGTPPTICLLPKHAAQTLISLQKLRTGLMRQIQIVDMAISDIAHQGG